MVYLFFIFWGDFSTLGYVNRAFNGLIVKRDSLSGKLECLHERKRRKKLTVHGSSKIIVASLYNNVTSGNSSCFGIKYISVAPQYKSLVHTSDITTWT